MSEVIAKLKAIVAAILAWPVIAPLLELLGHRSVLVLLAGLFGYALVPTIPWLPDAYVERVGNFVFYGTLLLSGRFSLQGLIEARGGLPATLDAYLRALLGEILMPTPEAQTSVSKSTTTTVTLAPPPTTTTAVFEGDHVG